jgi:hypothetical protein
MLQNLKKNYLSDIDKFLTSFDKNNECLSNAKVNEIDKSQKIKNLRD